MVLSIFPVLYHNADPPIRLLCSFDGKYLVQETTQALIEGTGRDAGHDLSQCLSFTCLLPDVTGRGFIEVPSYCSHLVPIFKFFLCQL